MTALNWSFIVCFLSCTIWLGDCFIGYELLETRLENLELNLKDLIETKVEKKIDNLISRLTKLETTGNSILSNQRSTENAVKDIVSKVSTVEDQAKQMLENHLDLVIPSCSAAKANGIYRLRFPRREVLCETANHGGGWLVIQHRLNGNTDFYQNRHAYRIGFGTVGLYTDFWLGLEDIHQITRGGEYELLVEIKNESNRLKYAQYDRFKVSSESDGYKLTVGGYSGTADDALAVHNNAKFSTYDWNGEGCAKAYRGGWWWNSGTCGSSNLNGPYKKLANGYGLDWGSWTKAGTYSRMMIRRK